MTADQLREFDLLPCPFCGAKPTSQWIGDEDGGYWEVSCNKCLPKDSSLMVTQFIGVHGHFEEECIQAWNTRPTAVASHAEGEVVAWQFRLVGSHDDEWLNVKHFCYAEMSKSPDIYETRALYTHPPRSGDEAGHVVVTRDSSGEIVAVTRQDDDGQILSVIAEKFTDDERRNFAAEHALTNMSVQAALAERGGENKQEEDANGRR